MRLGTMSFLFLGLVCLADAGRADMALRAWGDLVRSADLVVIGVVSDLERNADGTQLATLDIEQVFSEPKAGASDKAAARGGPSRVLVAGDPSDPDGARFAVGLRVLALLERPDARSSGSRKVFQAVGGEHGVMPLADAVLEPTRSWLVAMFAARNELDLELMEPLLRRSEPLPHPVLFASCLQELDERSADRRTGPDAGADAALLTEMTCAETGRYWADARRWALRAAGRERPSGAAPCMQEVALSDAIDGDTRVAAVQGLGDLGDAGPVPGFVALIETDGSDAEGEAEGPSDELVEAATLALGKIGEPSAIAGLRETALGAGFEVASTAVHALGLIGGRDAIRALRAVASETTDETLRRQARDTIHRLRQAN